MSSLAHDLDRVLSRVDPVTAGILEREVRSALVAAEQRTVTKPGVGALGYPPGYFESTAGSFVGEPLEAPIELLQQPRESW